MVEFNENENVSYYFNLNSNINKIAGFDLDHTIISPQFSIFPKNEYDWKYSFSEIKEKLTKLNKNYNVVIFTNQKLYHNKSKLICDRLNNFINDLGFKPSVIIAKNDDYYRKPNIGMWEFLNLNSETEIDKNNSFFIGDAAGRCYKNKKDFSSCDYKFALNIGIDFFTPQKYLNLKDPYKYLDIGTLPFEQLKLLNLNNLNIPNKLLREIIILVGLPSCGKTTFINKFFSEYQLLNSDIHFKKVGDLKKINNSNNKIIIDGCNHKPNKRKYFIKYANDNNYKVRAFYFNIDIQLSKHLNNLKMKIIPGYKKKSSIAFTTINKNMELPNLNEKFDSIEYINFVPLFLDNMHKSLFYQHS